MTQTSHIAHEKSLSQAIKDRRATPSFLSDPVPESDLKEILAAGLSAPSAYNLQPWRFVVVRDAAQRARLREAAMKQPKVEEAPVVIVACADLEGWKSGDVDEIIRLAQQHGCGDEARYESMRKNIAKFFGSAPGAAGGLAPDFAVWSNRQTMIAFTTMMWMAEALGYDTAPMEGYYEDQVKATLGIPAHVRVVALLAIGRRKGEDKRFAGRLAMQRTVFAETWGTRFRSLGPVSALLSSMQFEQLCVNPKYDAIILGAGAAGLMCAIEAGKRGRRILVLERADRIGKKILISGGGRCNFTNLHTGPENFISANPHFAKSALARYTPAAIIGMVEKHGIPYHQKKLGQLFCDRSASDITKMLEHECRDAGVDVRLNTKISLVERNEANGFTVTVEDSTFTAPRIVVATGGLSIAKIGATPFGYDLARQFSLKIIPPRPALVPLIFSDRDRKRWRDLAGVSTDVVAATPGAKQTFRENMLFTHLGLSGPAILQISSYWRGKRPLHLDLAPGRDLTAEMRSRNSRELSAWKAMLREILPRRFADRWLETYPLTSNSDRAFADAEYQLHRWELNPEGTEGYGKAEVTAGGVDTDELSAKTMESKKVPGLFFIGEVVDVTGQLGGFNFQWAWASGFCAGQAT